MDSGGAASRGAWECTGQPPQRTRGPPLPQSATLLSPQVKTIHPFALNLCPVLKLSCAACDQNLDWEGIDDIRHTDCMLHYLAASELVKTSNDLNAEGDAQTPRGTEVESELGLPSPLPLSIGSRSVIDLHLRLAIAPLATDFRASACSEAAAEATCVTAVEISFLCPEHACCAQTHRRRARTGMQRAGTLKGEASAQSGCSYGSMRRGACCERTMCQQRRWRPCSDHSAAARATVPSAASATAAGCALAKNLNEEHGLRHCQESVRACLPLRSRSFRV